MNIQEIKQNILSTEIEITRLEKEMEDFDKSDYFTEGDYKDVLNENTVTVCGMEYGEGNVLYEVDTVAFRCGFNDWVDSLDNEEVQEYRDLQDELDEAKDVLSNLQSELEEAESEEE